MNIPSSPVQAQRGTDERERPSAHEIAAANLASLIDGIDCFDNDVLREAIELLRADAEQLLARLAELEALKAALHGMLNRTKNIGQSKFPSKAHYEAFIDAYFTADAALKEKSRDAG